MSKRRIGVLGVGAGIVAIAALVYARLAPQRPTVDESHARMVQTLAAIKEQPSYQDRLFGGEARLQYEESRLAAMPASASIVQRIELLSTIGDLHLAYGHGKESAAHLHEAAELLTQIRRHLPPGVEETALLDVAVAHLRWGELENCLKLTTCQSCLLPIRGDGVHTRQQGSLGAVRYLNRVLELNPDNLTARWLLNIAHMTLGTYPDEVPEPFLIPPERFESEEEFPRFENVAAEVGLDTISLSGGVVIDDFDNDQRLDVVTSDWSVSGQLRYFQNTGDGTFRERTQEAGFEGLYGGLNALQADYDNDGDTDLLILRGAWLGADGQHPNSLLQNDGQGRFRDVTFRAGLGEVHYPTQAAGWADYDNDGDLDLYLGNEDYPCQLFENDGRGHFTDVAARAGVTNDRYTKGVSWGDFNGDGLMDLYVSNYGTVQRLQSSDPRSVNFFLSREGRPNRLYRNNGDGTFTDVAEELGVTRPLLSFPTWFWDFNNDGALDLFVAGYSGEVRDVAADFLGLPHQAEPSRLYQGDGRGGFTDVTSQLKLDRAMLIMGANFGDLDNDGFDDIYLGTGAPEYETLTPNRMFHNQAGQGFADVTTAGGFGHLQKGHGIAFGDLDNDGDQDVFAVLGGAFDGDFFKNALFENPGFGNRWVTIKLVGTRSNRSAIGARIRVEVDEDGATRSIYKWVNSGGSFGANPLRQHIGLGRAAKIRTVEVQWPASGETQTFQNVPLDAALEITEGQPDFRKLAHTPLQLGRPTR